MRPLNVLLIGWLLLLAPAAALAENPILQQLLDIGVPVGSGAPLKLPQPTMPDGLNAADQRKAIESIADANHPVDALLRDSPVSPYQIKIQTEENATGERSGRRIDIWFVVYGNLDTITKEGFFEEHFALGAKADADDAKDTKAGALTEEELKKRGLTVKESDQFKEAYAYSLFSVFDRVQVSGTGHVAETITGESALMASLLAPKFVDDAEYPNRWRSITRDTLGKTELGEPHPYSGYGSYVKATRLIEPVGALFIEFHLVFDEPQGWFNGANLLRSKVPVLAQDNIRKFRRELKPK